MEKAPRQVNLALVHVASGDLWAGGEVQVALLLPALARRGHRVTAILLNDGRLRRELTTAGIDVRLVEESRGLLHLWRALRAQFVELRPDVVHAHRYKEALVAFSASVGLARSRIRTLHGVREGRRRGDRLKFATYAVMEEILGRSLGGTTAIAVSQALREETCRYSGREVAWVPNAVVIPRHTRTRAAIRKELGVEGRAVLLFAGRLEWVKGVDILLDAFEQIERAIPTAVLLVAGDGSLRREIERRLLRTGQTEKVVLLGHRDDVPDLLHAADLVVLPSRGEGMPTLLLEAMATKVAVVATEVGGIPEVTRDAEAAALVRPEDPIALAEACAGLLGNAERRVALAERGRAVAESYSPDMTARLTEEIYLETVGGS